ncbi:hypothetical protein MMC25_002994 [Agyrium rufum]|nr:hypothetical protein [Agyrium rufum]
MTTSHKPRVAIIGGGPGGLCLTHLLDQAGIESTIFERDTSSVDRFQGGTLDLHFEDGLKAIKQMGLWEAFVKHARYEGEAIVIADRKGVKYFDEKPGEEDADRKEQRPEIDRVKLKEILLPNLPEGRIRWGSKFLSMGLEPTLKLHFEHGIEEGFDLVVGADGAWSRVRRYLSDTLPTYSGVAGFDLKLSAAGVKKYPHIANFVGLGSYFAFSDQKSATLQRLGDGGIGCYAWKVQAEDWQATCGYDVSDKEAVRPALLEQFKDWCPEIREYIKHADGDMMPRSLYMLPVGFTWEHKPNVTLIGDAAHLMTPFAGEGVNTCFADCLELADKLSEKVKAGASKEEFDAAVKEYEEGMFKRAAKVTRETKENMDAFFYDPNFPGNIMEIMAERMEGPPGERRPSAGQIIDQVIGN